jgi:hypothetical protein|tara:strand:+ start:4782 stop:5273 length:492 start_codon:yes stop_codon:yes gene_type:complete
MPVITGKSYWAKLQNAQNPFDESKPRWSIDVALNADGVKLIKGHNIPIKDKEDDRGEFVTMYKDQYLRDGTELPKPRLMDAQKNDISGTLIGNGSLVKVSFTPREWKMSGRAGVRAVLKDVQVLDLVSYAPPDEFEVEEGYTSTEEASTSQEINELDDDIPFD